LRVVGEVPRDPLERIVLCEARIVVEEEQELSADKWYPRVASSGCTKVFRELYCSHLPRQPLQSTTVTDNHKIDLHSPLAQHGFEC
jgi:hypothetical protein